MNFSNMENEYKTQDWHAWWIRVRLLVNDMKSCDTCTINEGLQNTMENDLKHLSQLQAVLEQTLFG